jgi:L-ectoine synthase
MKLKNVQQMRAECPARCVKGAGFESVRFLLESDNMGFTVCETIIPKGGPYKWHYKHHKEACYCVSGRGVLIDLVSGHRHDISPGTIYVLDQHDPHTFEATEDVVLISIFNPPLRGAEVHKEDGSYEI